MIDFTHNPIIPADYTSRGRGLPYEASPLRLFLIWCRRRDLSSAAAAPCILTVRRPSQATVPGSPLLAKNSPPDCFFLRSDPPGFKSHSKIKRAAFATLPYLVQEKGLVICCGCALHSNSSPTVASDSTRLTAPR